MCRKVTFLIFYSRTQFIEEFHFYSAVMRDEPHPSGEHGHRSLQFSPVNSGSLERCSVFPGGAWSVGTPVYNLVWALWFARCYGWREAGQAPSLLGFLLVLIIPHSRNREGCRGHTHKSQLSYSPSLSRLFLQPKKVGWAAFLCGRKIAHMLHPAPFPFYSLKTKLSITMRLLE